MPVRPASPVTNDLYFPRYGRRATLSQRWLSIGFWAATAMLALVANLAGPALSGIVFVPILAMAAVSILLSVRLPGGAYAGLLPTALAAAALAIGYQRSTLLMPIISAVAVPVILLLGLLVPRLRVLRERVVFELLWLSSAATLSLIAAGWVYEQMGGTRVPDVLIEGKGGAALVFVALFFLLMAAFTSIWLLLGEIDLREYWAHYWRPLFGTGLIATLALGPLMALALSFPWQVSLLGVALYALGALLLYNVTRAQISLTDRIADLHVLNNIGQTLNSNLDLADLLRSIHSEIGRLLDASGFYLCLIEDGDTLYFPIVYADGRAQPPLARPRGNSLTDYVIDTRHSLLLRHDVARQAAEMGVEPVGEMPHSFLGVPMIAGDQIVGALGLRNYTDDYAYDEHDQRVLETASSWAAIALQNAQLFRMSQRQAGELTSINEVAELVSTRLDLGSVIDTICRIVVDVVGCQKAAVFLLDSDQQSFHLAGSVGLSEAYREQSQHLDIAVSSRAQAIRTGEASLLENVTLDEAFDDVRELLVAEGIRAVLDVPLRIGDEVIGSLAAYFNQPHHFEDAEVELLHTLAGQVAVAVKNADLYEATTMQSRELRALYETGRAINASLSLQGVLAAVATSMLDVLNVESCMAVLVDEDRQVLIPEIWVEMAEGVVLQREGDDQALLQPAVPLLRQTTHDREVIPLHRARLEPNDLFAPLMEYFELESGLALPLKVHGDVLGLLIVGHRSRPSTYGPATARLARALADQASVAIQNARLFENTDVALTRRIDELAALEMISQRMARRLDLRTVIEQVVSAAALATGAEVSEVLLLDENRRYLTVEFREGPDGQHQAMSWPVDRGVVGQALRSGQPVLVPDVGQMPGYVETLQTTRSELAVPIILDQERLGVINLESGRYSAFDQDQARFISNLAEHAAIAIQNAQLFETVQERAEEFRTLRRIAIDLLSSTDIKPTLQVIAREAMAHIPANDIHIYLYEQSTGELTFGTSLWRNGDVDVEFAIPRPNGLTATVARTGERLVIKDPATHPLFENVIDNPEWHMPPAMVGAPLKRGNEVIGVFNVAYEDPAKITDESLHFLELLGAQAAVAIANARLTEQTRTGRDRLQAVLNSIHDGILMFDNSGRLVLLNPRASELLNAPLGETAGQLHYTSLLRRVARGLTGEDRDRVGEVLDLVRRIAADPTRSTSRSYMFHNPSLRVIEESSTPVIGENGAPIGRLFTLRDITHDYEIQTYRQEMSNMIVHDLRSPLAGVITGLNLALEEAVEIEVDIHQQTLEASVQVALSSANTLLRLVEEILDVNKLEAGEVPLMTEAEDLDEMIEQATLVLASSAADASIDIQVDIPPELDPVLADRDKIERVLVNLIDNALRYTPEGGLVRIGVTPGRDYHTVSVIDTGEGVPSEERERVFDRFFQGDVSRRKRGAKGSGLGLTFCRLVIEAHGGAIWVDDGPEGGAAFYFTLPVLHDDEY